MQSAEWDKSRKKFKQKNGHHYDLVASLVYLVRNANIEINPYPDSYGKHSDKSKYFMKGKSTTPEQDEFTEAIKNWFVVKPTRRGR